MFNICIGNSNYQTRVLDSNENSFVKAYLDCGEIRVKLVGFKERKKIFIILKTH
jgi:hypothetical protein